METPLGVRLVTLRKQAGLPQRELARLARVSLGYPAHIERGLVTHIGVNVAEKLAKVLGCTPEFLLLGSGDAPTDEAVKAAVEAATEASPKPVDAERPAPSAEPQKGAA